jgi:hypothetical protein
MCSSLIDTHTSTNLSSGPGWTAGHLTSPLQACSNTLSTSSSIKSPSLPPSSTKAVFAPTHQNFPHPAILHAICACTARHLGVSNIVLKSSHQEGNRLLLVRRSNERNALSPSAQRPTWDGMGQRPAHVSEVDGIEGDFGEVHLQVSKVVDRSKDFV